MKQHAMNCAWDHSANNLRTTERRAEEESTMHQIESPRVVPRLRAARASRARHHFYRTALPLPRPSRRRLLHGIKTPCRLVSE